MKKTILLAVLLFACVASAQTYIQIQASSCITDASGASLISGTMVWQATNSNNAAIPFANPPVQVTTTPVTGTIINGSITTTLNVSDPAVTSPTIDYHVVILDNTSKKVSNYNHVKPINDGANHFNWCSLPTGQFVAGATLTFTGIRSGTTVPANSLGGPGEFYIRTDTMCIYGPKTSVWPGTCTNLVGAQGGDVGTIPGAVDTILAKTALSGWQAQTKPVNDARGCDSSSDYGIKINTCVTAFGSGSGVIEVPATVMPATASTLITVGKNQFLEVRGSDTFNVVGLRGPDSASDNSAVWGVRCPEHATIKLSNGSNTDLISTTNFGTLTGTSNRYGTIFINDGCNLDGNKANNSSGWLVRLVGRRINLRNASMHDGASGGVYVEGLGTVSITNWNDAEQSDIVNSSISNNAGTQLKIVSTQAFSLHNVFLWSLNAGASAWGLDTTGPVNISGYLQVFMMGTTAGACNVHGGGSMQGSNAVCTADHGDGILLDTGTGGTDLSASSFSSINGNAIHLKSPGNKLSGTMFNSLIGVNFDGGSALLNLEGASNPATTRFKCTSFSFSPVVTYRDESGAGSVWDAATCGSATVPPATGTWLGYAGPIGNFISIAGIDLYSNSFHYQFPNINGTLAVSTATQTFSAAQYNSVGWAVNNAASFYGKNLAGGPFPIITPGSDNVVYIDGEPTAGKAINIRPDGSASAGSCTAALGGCNFAKLYVNGGSQITKHLSGSATLDFANLAAIGCEDLTIAVTGAVDGDTVKLGVPNASVPNGTAEFRAWVSAADTVTVRYCNLVSGDPASGTFKVIVGN